MLAFFLFVATLFVAKGADKVSLGLYYECPYSQAYIVGSLMTAWNTEGFSEIVDISLIPWGHETYNVSNSGEYDYQCQHGPNECVGQTLEACASKVTPSKDTFITFIIELEYAMKAVACQNSTNCCDPTAMAQLIANKLQMPWGEIESCVKDKKIANSAEMEMYNQTMALVPKLTGVPWITLQGNHTDQIQNDCSADTVACVCAQYKGNAPLCAKRTHK